jgi:hypothetical protein
VLLDPLLIVSSLWTENNKSSEELRPDVYHCHNFKANSRCLKLSEFQRQEEVSVVLRTSDTKADFCYP